MLVKTNHPLKDHVIFIYFQLPNMTLKAKTLWLPVLFLIACKPKEAQPLITSHDYRDLVTLFNEWRSFEVPPMLSGAPDYTAETFDLRYPEFKKLQSRLSSIDSSGWPVDQQVDYEVVKAEMNGYDFNYRILKPWQRDPAFYTSIFMERSDVPAHEGPTPHGAIDIWQYSFPLRPEAKLKLIGELNTIPPFLMQAQSNLTGNAKDLWITGIRPLRTQREDLQFLSDSLISQDTDLTTAVRSAMTATDQFITWLEAESKNKTGPSGLGKENYTWYQQNVHLVPLTWDEEVMLLKRELARAWSALKLEEHHNRNLPLLPEMQTPEAYDKLADQSAASLMHFLRSEDILTIKDYFEPALREHLTHFTPKEKRNFFAITTHYDARPLYSHFYHWFELATMDREPHTSEIRKGPLLYNIFDTHNEGIATAVEEIFMHAGLYDDSPRSKEIVYIMVAQRAARGLGSLYAQANIMTMEEAGGIHSEYTPRGWMKTEPELRIFEQNLYLRQPGYGTSYITGKYLIDQTMAAYARQKEAQGEPFKLKDFLDGFNATGNVPVSLGYWEMTGKKM